MPKLTIEVTTEVEKQLKQEAHRRETTVGDCASRLLEDALKGTLMSEPFFERLAAAGERISAEDWANVPTDAAENLDRYLYGAAKKSR